jgi:hypothetical protein
VVGLKAGGDPLIVVVGSELAASAFDETAGDPTPPLGLAAPTLGVTARRSEVAPNTIAMVRVVTTFFFTVHLASIRCFEGKENQGTGMNRNHDKRFRHVSSTSEQSDGCHDDTFEHETAPLAF